MSTIVNTPGLTFEWLRSIQGLVAQEAKRKPTPDAPRRLTRLDSDVAISLTRWITEAPTFFRSHRDIAADCGCSEEAARLSVDRLKAAGFLSTPDTGPKISTERMKGRPATTYQAQVPGNFPKPRLEKEDRVSPSPVGKNVEAEGVFSPSQTPVFSPSPVGPNRGSYSIDKGGDTPLPPKPEFSEADAMAAEPETGTQIIAAETNAPARAQKARPGSRSAEAEIIEPDGFVAFWEAWPPYKRNRRKRAEAEWSKAVKAGADPRRLIGGAMAYRALRDADERSSEDRIKYTADPANWLRDERWDEAIEAYQAQRAEAEQPIRRAAANDMTPRFQRALEAARQRSMEAPF